MYVFILIEGEASNLARTFINIWPTLYVGGNFVEVLNLAYEKTFTLKHFCVENCLRGNYMHAYTHICGQTDIRWRTVGKVIKIYI